MCCKRGNDVKRPPDWVNEGICGYQMWEDDARDGRRVLLLGIAKD